MNGGKDLLQSNTFWGSATTTLGLLLSQYGIHINVSATASAIVTIIGLVMTVIGRINAQKPVTSIAGMKVKSKTPTETPK